MLAGLDDAQPWTARSLAAGEPPLITPDDLRHFVLLHDEIPTGLSTLPTWETWLKAAGAKGVDASSGPRFNNSFLTLEMAIAGKGVALALSTLVSADLTDGRLVKPFALSLPCEFSFFVLCPPTSLKTPKIQTFRTWLHEEARS